MTGCGSSPYHHADGFTGRVTRYASSGSLQAFTRRYVPASLIAAKEGRSARAVIAELGRRGVLPAFGPPAFRQVIYLRAAISRRGD